MIGVFDSSAVVRLFIPDGPIPEGMEQFLKRVEIGDNIALAPELMLAEIANVLHKKTLRDEISGDECDQILILIQRLPIRLFSHKELVEGAVQLARDHAITVYDALFLELARQQNGKLFTADLKLEKAGVDFL
jgi:predicted nucleic acid-binding protein